MSYKVRSQCLLLEISIGVLSSEMYLPGPMAKITVGTGYVVAGQLQTFLNETDYLDSFQLGSRPWFVTGRVVFAFTDD